MPRPILDESRLHPAIAEKVGRHHDDHLDEVIAAVEKHDVVVVGMEQNPFPKKARKLLDARGVRYEYLEYGSYLSQWRPRTTLKMWSGWPTFPMVFVKGTLIGGASQLEKLAQSGELDALLKG